MPSPVYLLAALAFLLAYLFYSIDRRRRAEEATWLAKTNVEREKWLELLKQLPEADSAAASIAPQIQMLRMKHPAARHPRPSDLVHRRGLVAAARRIVGGLAFFRGAGLEPEMAKRAKG